MSFVLSKRGAKMLVHENHIYHFSKKTANGEHTIWICEKRTSCKGRVWTIGDSPDIFKIIAGHEHPAQAAKPEVIQTVNKIKNKAKETEENPQQILASSLDGVHKNVLALLPRKESIKRCIRKIKNQNDIPTLPTTIEELVIPEEFAQITIDGRTETFLVHDSLLPQRMLIFSTKDNLAMLAKSDEWFADGTFDTCPPHFHQIYTVHVNNKYGIFPVVYALLPNKTRSTYSKLLKVLKNLQPGMNPGNLMTDFEIGAINAFQEEFPRISTTGCFFHLAQNIWRKVQELKLQITYQNSHEFAVWVRMFPALAFVPVSDVELGFTSIIEAEDFPEELLPLADYFEDTYIGRPIPRRQQRRSAIFPYEKWNVFERTLNGQHRTNNQVEGWHRGFYQLVGHHPNIFKFINLLKKQQALHNYEIQQLLSGQPPSRRNKKYVNIANRLQRAAENYNQETILVYLQNITHNFEF